MATQPNRKSTTSTTTRTVTSRPTNSTLKSETTYTTSNKKQEEIVVPGGLKFSKVIVWLMYFWVIVGVVSLSLRVFLLVTSANTATGFSNFIMRLSADYLEPFRGLYTGRETGETGYLDISAIFAIFVYLFIAWGIHSLINYVQNKIDISVAEQRAQGRVKKV